jgi:hypothetical protein
MSRYGFAICHLNDYELYRGELKVRMLLMEDGTHQLQTKT